jgi:hypothetical protein
VALVPHKTLLERASQALGQPGPRLQAAVQDLKKAVGPPWGADQKAAALVAWMLLATGEAGAWRIALEQCSSHTR